LKFATKHAWPLRKGVPPAKHHPEAGKWPTWRSGRLAFARIEGSLTGARKYAAGTPVAGSCRAWGSLQRAAAHQSAPPRQPVRWAVCPFGGLTAATEGEARKVKKGSAAGVKGPAPDKVCFAAWAPAPAYGGARGTQRATGGSSEGGRRPRPCLLSPPAQGGSGSDLPAGWGRGERERGARRPALAACSSRARLGGLAVCCAATCLASALGSKAVWAGCGQGGDQGLRRGAPACRPQVEASPRGPQQTGGGAPLLTDCSGRGSCAHARCALPATVAPFAVHGGRAGHAGRGRAAAFYACRHARGCAHPGAGQAAVCSGDDHCICRILGKLGRGRRARHGASRAAAAK
jgi:hypothetical protein